MQRMTIKFLTAITAVFINLMSLSAKELKFSDPRFKSYLLTNDSINFDSNKKEISTLEAQSFNGMIDVSNMKIKSLEGIDAFVKLTKLICSGNKLTTLDLSKNLALEFLDCKNNSIEHLNISQNQFLIEAKIYNNQISNISLTGNVNLVHLSARNNPFKTLERTR
jgi:hypothetical protein